MAQHPGTSGFKLEVLLDASAIEDFKPDQKVKVLVQGAKGPLASILVTLDDKGHGVAKFAFAAAPGSVRVILGPHDATDEDLPRLNTVGVDIPAGRWVGQTTLKLPPIAISRYYWEWWRIWCRTFIICGRVVCPDGSPVVGATVCAYDVDRWWWWSSTQQIGCATTDITGSFCMKFTWCCGWWDWWWWNARPWQIDPELIEHIIPVLDRDPGLRGRFPLKAQPSINEFREFLGAEAAHLSGATAINSSVLASLRERLLPKLPPSPELQQKMIWPWYPWQPPWNDCTPDVIFKVTQNCTGTGDPNVIVNETIWDTRWNISTTLNNVTLVANSKACCAHHGPCPGTNCMVLTTACGDTIDNIGGNVGATYATPVRHHNPNGAGVYSDQPYAGTVPIGGIADCLFGYDYYEFEWATSSGGPWNPMPPNADGAFTRTYYDSILLPGNPFVPVQFSASTIASTTGTQNVYETPQHYEGRTGSWVNRAWVYNYDLLINWQTTSSFADGTYYLRLKGWKYNTVTNKLDSQNILDICGDSPNDNYVVLTVDNRIVGPGPNDLHGDACTSVHTCTNEPDTKIISVKILNASQYNGVTTSVDACGIYNVKWPDKVQIDFIAYDPDGYLAEYGLSTYFGTNLSRNLLGLSHTLAPSLLPWSGPGPVPVAAQVGPNYPNALTQLAARPSWDGGVISLVLWATDDPSNWMHPNNPNLGAFPISCCYQLRLDAHKRTIVNCYGLFTNTSESSFTINVIP